MSEEQIKVTYIDHCGSDLTTVNAARVSFGKKVEVFDKEKDTKLIHYLAKHKHISPFGHAFASFHVKAPIFVARQLVKHKFLRWNEISRRYVDDTPEVYTPDVFRNAPVGNIKQGSSGKHYDSMQWLVDSNEMALDCINLYNRMIEDGVAPEQARAVLPQGTLTEFYWSGSLDAFASMCNLRLKDDTQYESRLVAQQIDKVMSDLFPVSWPALMENL